VVSSALVLMEEIIRARYSPSEWNIYGAQASDGDNWHHDSGRCRELLADHILPLVRYFAYVQVAEEEQNLWEEYARLAENQHAKTVPLRPKRGPILDRAGQALAVSSRADTLYVTPVFYVVFGRARRFVVRSREPDSVRSIEATKSAV